MLTKEKHRLRIISVNINAAGFNSGIQSRESQIHELLADTTPDVAFLLECDTRNYKVNETFKATGYKQFASAPSPVGQNKVMKTRCICLINFKTIRASRQIKEGVNDRAEIWVELTLKNGSKLICGGIYREWIQGRAGRDDEGMLEMVSRLSGNKMLILGDMNACVVKGLAKPESEQGKYIDELQQRGLTVLEDGYTFYRKLDENRTIKSGLDWGACNVDGAKLIKRWTPFSDHASVSVDLDGAEARNKVKRRGRNNDALYSKESQIALAEGEWSGVYMHENGGNDMHIAGLAARLAAMIIQHKDRVAPEKTRWVTLNYDIRATPKLRSIQRAISKAIREERFGAVARLKRRYRNTLRNKKLEQANRLIAKEGPGAIWGILRNVTQPDRVDIEIVENAITLTAKQSAEKFLVFFDEKVRKLRARANPDGRVPKHRDGAREGAFDFRRVTESELLKKIGRMKTTGSVDDLGLSQVDMKKLARALVTPLTSIINLSLETGIYPEVWKCARVVPCPKIGKDHSKVESFRPLSMLLPFGKLCEMVVKDQLQEHASRTGFVPASQHGYQRGRSCDTAIGQAMRAVDENVRKSRLCAIVMYDYSAAFDLVDSRLLDDKLRLMGCSRRVRKWVRSYLSDRTILVEVGGEKSRKIILEYGSPQGSVLSPLLFIVLISDMELNMPGVMIGYCDDSTNILQADTIEELRKCCEESISKMDEYASMMGLCLNLGKTEAMCFGKNKLGNLRVRGEVIEESESMKFLGVWISKRRSLKTHIDKIAPKLNAKIGVLRRILNVLPIKARKQVAMSTVGGVIQSCSLSAIDPIYKKGNQQILRLQRIYNAAARLTLRKRRRDLLSTEELMKELGTDTVRQSATVRMMKAAYQIYGPEPTLGFLADLEGDEKIAQRERRGLNAKLLREWKEGLSLTAKARGAWNILEKSGLSKIKESPSLKVFEKEVRAGYSAIWKTIQNEWENTS